MRAVLAIVLAMVVSADQARSQESRALAFYGDEYRTHCEIVNTEEQTVTIHMFLTGAGHTANTVTYYAPTPACWTGAVWLGDDINADYLFLGNTHHTLYGITITFVGCEALPAYLGFMRFWASGSDPCCHYDVFPGQAATVNQLRIIECDGTPREIPYSSVTVNPDESCPCAGMIPVVTWESTWGRVKSLYR